MGVGSAFYARLNGNNLAGGGDLNNWEQLSPTIFVMNFPPGGIFTGGDYTGPIDSVQRGWWLMLSPLAVGNYTLQFGGTATPSGFYNGSPPNVQNITYNLRVVPEPPALTLGLIASACAAPVLFFRVRARTRRS